MTRPDIYKTVSTQFRRFCVRYRDRFRDAEAEGLKGDAADLGVEGVERVAVARIYYVGGALTTEDLSRLGHLLADPITEEVERMLVIARAEGPKQSQGEIASSSARDSWRTPRNDERIHTVEVAYRPGVRDPVEDSLKKGALDLGIRGVEAVHTAKEYTLLGTLTAEGLQRICDKLLVNATIQQIVTPESLGRILQRIPAAAEAGGAASDSRSHAALAVETVHLLQASDTVLQRISLDHQLSLNLEEMRAIQAHFRGEGREPRLIELETLAQTWSEHCKHKTFRGSIVYTEQVDGRAHKRVISNLFQETIGRVTEELAKPWCVSVFTDNSGVIRFDDQYDVCFKVETHNHPSALEPFGGASTGLGGVIRDILGTGLGAKPVASTDVFCFAPPDTPAERVPPGALHPRRIIQGVVAGVKDYGNKMGIPTVNGAVLFDERFVGNPLVYCGCVGLLPAGKARKAVRPGMAIVVAGGRTGRDGVHGATFSSLALVPESETVSATAVQIGDPITEKRLADALLEARDQGLFAAVTDCGAGGLSSAVGEMGAVCGAQVHLERVPLKYEGLTPAEIWISESQERMAFAVPKARLDRLLRLLEGRGVEAAAIGEFTGTGRLELFFRGSRVGELKMDFLHGGVPSLTRPARWSAPACVEPTLPAGQDLADLLLKLLGRWDTCSKEWIVRQYDHEVQGGSVIKPLVEGRSPFDSAVHPEPFDTAAHPELVEGKRQAQGERCIGPSDAAVFRPRLDSPKALILANGINFRYGDLDPYWMAALAVDEAVRQVIAVGGSTDRLAILDNFCWGDPGRVEVLGSLVRAALGCSEAARAFGTPFISGKDSLHNEYRFGEKTIQIPGTLLISGIAILEDAGCAVSMDAKREGNRLYLVGLTRKELGGSAYYDLLRVTGGQVPRVDFHQAPRAMRALSQAISAGLVVAAHDCSEGGLAVAAAEMAFAGGLGLTLDLRKLQVAAATDLPLREDEALFSESASRLLVEVPPARAASFERKLKGQMVGRLGQFDGSPIFRVIGFSGQPVLELEVSRLREAWEAPFRGW